MTKWDATDHAKKRVKERFGIALEDALNWINQKMEHAEYVTNAPDAYGKMRRVFIARGTVFHTEIASDMVLTVIRAQLRQDWSQAIRKAAEKELRKFNLAAVKEERSLITERATLEIELVEVKAEMLAARSAAKKNAGQARYIALSERLAEVERALIDNRRSVVRMAESFSAVM